MWSENEAIVAIALLDGPDLLRFAVDPERCEDQTLAARITTDVADPSANVLGAGSATIEARGAGALTAELAGSGWLPDETWTPLRCDPSAPVESPDPRIELVEPHRTREWVSVHWSAFRGTPAPGGRLRALADGWSEVARGPFLDAARILLLCDEQGRPVAVSAVWSAGDGRPGLIEPLGVPQDHRGRGHGAIMTRAAAAHLRDKGACSATVAAESTNVTAVATYRAAGFHAGTDVHDWRRVGEAPTG
ncbi:GNAT family N-acetyltransferase [Microbacterium sp. NPDC077184]|uniref:GNAT family N-acetyltransferase n=1 Tax=Microbacterium sp. NPDC077184 TaxID=3154764 RepID=UPI00341BB979